MPVTTTLWRLEGRKNHLNLIAIENEELKNEQQKLLERVHQLEHQEISANLLTGNRDEILSLRGLIEKLELDKLKLNEELQKAQLKINQLNEKVFLFQLIL